MLCTGILYNNMLNINIIYYYYYTPKGLNSGKVDSESKTDNCDDCEEKRPRNKACKKE